MSATCPGPLVWFPVLGADESDDGAVLECGACGHVVVTGSCFDDAHAQTPVIREGLSA